MRAALWVTRGSLAALLVIVTYAVVPGHGGICPSGRMRGTGWAFCDPDIGALLFASWLGTLTTHFFCFLFLPQFSKERYEARILAIVAIASVPGSELLLGAVETARRLLF